MRPSKSFGLLLPEFATALAAFGLLALAVQPILAQARIDSRKLSAFHPNTAFQMYAADFDGGFSDFQGKPVLTDGLRDTLGFYGAHAAGAMKKAAKPTSGCMPIVFFRPSARVAATGQLTFWEGQVGNASATCSVGAYAQDESVLVLPDWGSVPTDTNGNFWLVAGAAEQGVGTLAVETNSGATAANSVLVLD